MRCSTCGAPIAVGAIACTECAEPFSVALDDGAHSRKWLESTPLWLRWLVALPCTATIGAVAVRQLELAGLRDASSGIIYPVAAALTIYAAALVGANAAPSYRKHVGLAIAFADFAICVVALLAATILASNVEPLLPPNMLFLYLLIPTSGVAFTAFSLAGNKSLINKPLVTTKIPSAALGVRWFLGLSVALSSAAAFEAVSIGVSALWPTALPRVSANILATLIGTGITVTLVAEYAPVGKMVAAWVAAGAFMVISVASIVILAVHFVRHGFGYGLIQFWGTYYFVYFLATISGAVLGLRASAVRSNVSPSLP